MMQNNSELRSYIYLSHTSYLAKDIEPQMYPSLRKGSV